MRRGTSSPRTMATGFAYHPHRIAPRKCSKAKHERHRSRSTSESNEHPSHYPEQERGEQGFVRRDGGDPRQLSRASIARWDQPMNEADHRVARLQSGGSYPGSTGPCVISQPVQRASEVVPVPGDLGLRRGSAGKAVRRNPRSSRFVQSLG